MDEDLRAAEWLKANPTDPDAFAVFNKLSKSGKFQLNPQNQQAYEWVLANPTNPDTDAVKQKLIQTGLDPLNRPEPEKSIGDKIIDIATTPVLAGTSVGERVPIIGPLARKAAHGTIAAIEAARGDKPFGEAFPQKYGELEQESAAQAKQYAEKHPVADVALSGVASMGLPIPGGQWLGAAKGSGTLARAGMKAADIAAKAGTQYGVSATDTLARGEGMEKAKESGEMAGALTAGAEILPGALKLAGRYASRYVFGVPPKLAQKYLGAAERINKVDEEQLKELVDNTVGKLRESADAAKEAFDVARGEAQGAQSMAKYSLSQTKPQLETVRDALDDIKALRKSISEQSGKSFEALRDAPPANISGSKSLLTSRMGELKIAGEEPIGAGKEGFAKLFQYRKYTDKIAPGGNIRAEDLKKFIQSIDDDTGPIYDKMARGEYVSRGERALLDLRRSLNEEILANPEYAKIMGPLAEDTKLLTALTDLMPTEQAGLYAMKRAATPEGARIKDLLSKLQEKSGKGYISEIEKQQIAQEIRRNPELLKKHLEALPETKRVKELLAIAEKAKAELAPVKGVSEMSSQNLIRSVASEARPNLARREQLKYIGEKAGQDVLQQAEDLGIKRALEGGFRQGSRNVNLGAISLGGLGGIFSQVAGMMGAPVGAIVGSVMDISGPQMWKKIADASMTPQFQKYSGILGAALQKSPQAFMQKHNELMERDRVYNELINRQGGQ